MKMLALLLAMWAMAPSAPEWTRARAAADALGSSAAWQDLHAWQRFVAVDALAVYAEHSGDRRSLPMLATAVRDRSGLDGNDDDLWAVLAALDVYRQAGGADLLAYAEAKFAEVTRLYWDGTCGGGIWWDHARTYKNAITNELLLYAATELWRSTHAPLYREWAAREWKWFSGSGLVNGEHLVNDGLTKECRNNGQATYTYNQGILLGGLVGLAAMDGDRGHLLFAGEVARAAMLRLSRGGVLEEAVPELNQDGQSFKGIFVLQLATFARATPDASLRKDASRWLVANADAVWQAREPGTNRMSAYWGAGAKAVYGTAAQAQALALLTAAAETRELP
jgi:predicted alpha-1,6-mannanase (GH76 family)